MTREGCPALSYPPSVSPPFFRVPRGDARDAVDGHETEELLPAGDGDRPAISRNAERFRGALRVERCKFPARCARVAVGDEVLLKDAVDTMFVDVEKRDGLAVRQPAHASQDRRRM